MRFPILKSRFSNPWIAFILIAIATFVIYSNIYRSGFIFDSVRRIEDNPEIRNLTNYISFDQLLKPRAIVDLTFALNYRFGELSVFGYRFVNVLIHIINGCIVYLLASMICKQLDASLCYSNTKMPEFPNRLSQSIALFSSLIFIAHPIQTQAVTYTAQRYASMAAMFYMASTLFYLKARIVASRSSGLYASHGRQSFSGRDISLPSGRQISKKLFILYFLSVLCGMLAYLSKQNTASLPAAFLLVEYLLIDRTWHGWKKKIPWFVAFFVLWTLFVLTISGIFRGESEGVGLLEDVSGMMIETETVSRWHYLCTQFNVLVIYIRLLILPVKQNLDYFYPFKTGFFDGLTPLAFMFHVIMAAAGIWSIKRRPVVAFSIFFFYITLSVESSIIPIRDALFEHRLYLPMFGFGLFVAYYLCHLLFDKQGLILILAVLLIGTLGTSTYMRNTTWKDNTTLWSDVVSNSPHNHRGHINLGAALLGHKRLNEAIHHFKEALRIKPNSAEALNNLALTLSEMGNHEEGAYYFQQALRVHPEDAYVHYNFGMNLFEQGKIEEAGTYFFEAIKLKPDYAEAYNILGIVMAKQKNYQKAGVFFSKAIQIKPDYDDPQKNLEALNQIFLNATEQANE